MVFLPSFLFILDYQLTKFMNFWCIKRTSNVTSIGLFYKEVGRLWREYVRVINIYTSQEMIMRGGVRCMFFRKEG